MDKFYFVNYNKLYYKDVDELIECFLYDENLSFIAAEILINENRILDNNVSYELLNEFINSLRVEDIWNLASNPRSYLASRLAYKRLMQIMDEVDVNHNRKLLKVIK